MSASSKSAGRFFGRLFNNKRFNMVFSLLFAFVFWLVITIDQHPTRERTFNDVSLNISLENTLAEKRGLEIVSDFTNEKFSVKVSGPNYLVSPVTKDDFYLSVDLSTVVEAGTYNLEVIPYQQNTNNTGYEFVSVSPSTVRISFDKIRDEVFTLSNEETKRLIVQVDGDENVAEGHIVDPDYLNDRAMNLVDAGGNIITSLALHGPDRILNTIDSVVAYTKIDGPLEKTDSYMMDLKLLGNDKKVLYTCVSNGKTYEIFKGENTDGSEQTDDLKISVNVGCVKITIPVQVVNNIPIVVKDQSGSLLNAVTVPSTVAVRGDAKAFENNVTAILRLKEVSHRERYAWEDLELPSGIYLAENAAHTSIMVNY